MERWDKGKRTVEHLVGKGRLESFEAEDLRTLADALIGRAERRVHTTAAAALKGGDVDGAYVAAYDAYRWLRNRSWHDRACAPSEPAGHTWRFEDAVSAQFATGIPAFAKPTFERFRCTRHSAQYFDPAAAPITKSDALWAINKATAAVSGVRELLAASPPERFS